MPQSSIRADARAGLREELRNVSVQPLLSIEKKLIAWSLSIGLGLLLVLAVISHFFRAVL